MQVKIGSGIANKDPDNRDFTVTLIPETAEENEALEIMRSFSSISKTFHGFLRSAYEVSVHGVGVTVSLFP